MLSTGEVGLADDSPAQHMYDVSLHLVINSETWEGRAKGTWAPTHQTWAMKHLPVPGKKQMDKSGEVEK